MTAFIVPFYKNLVVILLLAGLSLPTSAQMTSRQATLLANNCVQCHSKPGLGAPIFGDAASWAPLIAKGEDALLINVVQGIGSMPPAGYCAACDEQDLRVLIRAIAGMPDPKTKATGEVGEEKPP
ncbi:MAG: cytochrome c5 family protein [Pseudomonadales bacterium]